MNRNTDIRQLELNHLLKLSNILDSNQSWEKLMEFIPKDLTQLYNESGTLLVKKYTGEHIR